MKTVRDLVLFIEKFEHVQSCLANISNNKVQEENRRKIPSVKSV